MVMEVQKMYGGVMDVVDEGYISDSEAFSSVVDVLTGVAMAPNMVDQSDRDQYDFLVSILNPEEGKDPEQEALLVTALKALSGAISKLNITFHASLLSNIFSMSVWNYGFDTRKAVLELIISLATVPDKFLDGCLHMLVANFMPPPRMRAYISHPRFTDKRNIHSEVFVALHRIVNLVPLAPMMLKDIIDKRMPKATDKKEVIVIFVKCMLELENNEIGEFLGSTLLIKVVELLVDLDVNINWEDILHEEHNKGIFDMELEDVEENGDGTTVVGTKQSKESGQILKGNEIAGKLDSLMVIVCEYLQSCASDEHLVKDCDECLQIKICSDIFVSNTEDPISRMSSVAYLASYLSRAKFIPSSLVASILKRLVDWCFEYCQFRNGWERTVYPKAHRVFYSGCQAVMYVLAFRMRSLMDTPHLKSLLFQMPLESILFSSLEPLKVCLPTIVHEFLRQAKAAHLFKTSATLLDERLLESEFSKAFGGMQRLDMFFPFDPYLLKESDRFVRPNFEFWSMVKTTYSSCNSEDEDEDLDFPLDDHDNIDIDSESDENEIGDSMSKMSITPRPAFQFHMMGNNGSQMPARIRLSVSPED